MSTLQLLQAIGSTEPSSFNEICQGLGDHCPGKGDSQGWGTLFRAIDNAERDGLLEVSRTQGRIDTAILTDAGVAELARLDSLVPGGRI